MITLTFDIPAAVYERLYLVATHQFLGTGEGRGPNKKLDRPTDTQRSHNKEDEE